MKTLIVEDNDDKARQIRGVLFECVGKEGVLVKSVRAAYPALSKNRWDLVILDMTLHAADGLLSSSTKESLAGIEVLQAMSAGHNTAKVIVATQHEVFKQDTLLFESVSELDAALHDQFPDLYLGCVKVRLGSESWKKRLQSMILEMLP